jgi:hypothetical protein
MTGDMVMPPTGRMSWAQAIAGPLAGATCLWQDLDGLHVAPAPAQPPYTSIVWGWRDDALLVRVRIDAGTAFVAVHAPAGPGVGTVPWDGEDGRVAAARGPSVASDGVGAKYEQVVVPASIAGGPVTFIRPADR